MSAAAITPVVMPKWGLSMREGTINEWLVEEGVRLNVGDEIVEVETDKISGAVEATDAGVLRKQVAQAGDVIPVRGLLAVLADPSVTGEQIDSFVQEHQAGFVLDVETDDEIESAYQFIEVQGIRLRYSRQGESGDPVFLLHGFGGDLDNWLFNVQALAVDHTVYVLDLPGHGQSSKRLDEISLEGLTRTVVAFMDAIGISHAHIVGHSMGGAIALRLAATDSERVLSLALIASAGLGVEINRDYIDGFVRAQGRRDLKPHLQLLFVDPAAVTRQMMDDILKYKRLDGVESFLTSLALSAFPEGRQQAIQPGALAELRMPVLVVWGAEDQIIPARHARELPGDIRREIIAGAGHMVQMEAAAAVNELLRQHLKEG